LREDMLQEVYRLWK